MTSGRFSLVGLPSLLGGVLNGEILSLPSFPVVFIPKLNTGIVGVTGLDARFIGGGLLIPLGEESSRS